MTLGDGIQGDLATATIAMNAIPTIAQAQPGLVCIEDLPPIHSWPMHLAGRNDFPRHAYLMVASVCFLLYPICF